MLEVTLSASGGLLVHIPSPTLPERGNTIELPAGFAGYSVLLRILKAQAKEAKRFQFFGGESRPTQYIVDAWLRENKPAKAAERKSLPTWAESLEVDI